MLPFVAAPTCTIKALDRSTWPAFAALVEHNNGIYGGCWCTAFHPEGGDRAAQGEVNRERKHERVRAGTAYAALVFAGEECVGWCQFGVPGEVARIENRAAYERSQTAAPDWRIACCFVGKGHRRQGVSCGACRGSYKASDPLYSGVGKAGSSRIESRSESPAAHPIACGSFSTAIARCSSARPRRPARAW
jgi:hypothetical protein